MSAVQQRPQGAGGITRPKGRVRIETGDHPGEVGADAASPGRKAGCGLKHFVDAQQRMVGGHHPAERPGAD